MRLLLDTHVVLWWRLDAPDLPRPVRRAVATADQVFVSAASAWEVAIKVALGKLRLDESFAAMVDDSAFERLPVSFEHAGRLQALPPHHADPFDRMLVAQAQVEGLTLVTADVMLGDYDVTILWR
jgi:PIN domain nuclease of toxin-antitoxin system